MRAITPFMSWRAVINHPWWRAIVITARAFITPVFIAPVFGPPARIAPATTVPIMTAVIAIADV
jgi:hypothetical protein